MTAQETFPEFGASGRTGQPSSRAADQSMPWSWRRVALALFQGAVALVALVMGFRIRRSTDNGSET